MHRNRKLHEAITLAIASTTVGISGTAFAQQGDSSAQDEGAKRLEEVTVTATKRVESLQDIPIAIQALDEEALENRDIQTFDDWVKQAPSVQFSGRGPGQNTIYMRGITTGGGIYSSGRVGSTTSVAYFIDEAAMTTVGRNIDVYLTDVSRVEILPGPQGTLYGQSSQAGTIRIVTNQPVFNEWEGRLDVTGNTVYKGGTGYALEGVVNVPIIDDRLALRIVGYNVEQAGWIDNVPNTISYRDNIFLGGRTLAEDAVIEERDNFDRAEADFNQAVYTGGRITGLLRINDNWDLTAGMMAQRLDVEGVWDFSPDIGDQEISRYEDETLDDEFIQFNLTVEGRLGMLDVVYAGAYIDQDIDQWADYTTNVYDTPWLIFYNCTYTADFSEIVSCQAPNETFHLNEEKSRMQHELRVSTDPSRRASFIGGIWYTQDEVLGLQEWQYHDPANFAQNAAFSGARTFYPPRPPETAFWNEILQESDELAFFGEFTYEFTEKWSATLGIRHSMIDVKPYGSYNTATFGPVDGDGGGSLDDFEEANEDQTIFKGNLTYRPNLNMMFYATYSEGFRRGGFNRQGDILFVDTGEVAFPAFFKSDLVDNYEIGWKLELLNNRLRFNGAAFFLDWTDQQIGIFDPPLYGITAFTANLAGSEVRGLESDFSAILTDNLTMTGAFTLLDGEITELPETGAEGIRPVGSELSRVPDFSGTLNFRYDFRVFGVRSYATFGVQHTGEMIQGLGVNDSQVLDAWTVVDASLGMDFDRFSVRLLGSNLTDERQELSKIANGGPVRIRTGRPRTLGLRLTYNF